MVDKVCDEEDATTREPSVAPPSSRNDHDSFVSDIGEDGTLVKGEVDGKVMLSVSQWTEDSDQRSRAGAMVMGGTTPRRWTASLTRHLLTVG